MEEYIKLEEEKARRRGRVFNWQTATYGKIRVNDDLYDLRSVETEFPAIVIDDAFELQDALPYKSQVCTPVNDEIDFRISFDESDDEDYTIIYDKNSFSYKMIFVNNLKMDSENDNEKVMPSIPSPEPAIYMALPQSGESIETTLDAYGRTHVDAQRSPSFVSTSQDIHWSLNMFKVGAGARRQHSERRGQFILALDLYTDKGDAIESGTCGNGDREDLFYLLRWVEWSWLRFMGSMAKHFGLLDSLRNTLEICVEIDDTWAWVAMGPKRQPDAAAGAPTVVEDAPAADKGDQARILAPVVTLHVDLWMRSMITDQGEFSTMDEVCVWHSWTDMLVDEVPWALDGKLSEGELTCSINRDAPGR
ncbi:hypothetical protein Tco_0811657 [Tanacetum coccineum]